MEIRKIELNLGQKVANPFKTTRKSSTNPFYSTNFEGNTIDPLICADVLESFKGKESKLKMITASVMGSMTKLRNSITEPIINFVHRVREGITNAWTYAKNTEIKLGSLEGISTNINNVMNYDVGKGISDSISGLHRNITENITELGHGISDKWSSLISKISLKNIGNEKISSDLSVAELRALWEKENELIGTQAKEVSLNNTIKEVKVA